jgi:hypothetical protein
MTGLRWALLGAALLAAVVSAGVALLFAAQRAALFPAPQAGAPETDASNGVVRSWVDGKSGRTELWLLPALGRSMHPGPLLVFAHGNGELIDSWAGAFAPARAAGVAVLLVEYPGYGRSPGRSSEASVAASLVAAYDWASARAEIDPDRIVGWGRSLGGGAICALARERRLAALVLESTFTSVSALARRFGLPRLLVRDPFESLEVVRTFDGPILIVHGEHDELIPPTHARALHDAAPGSELHLLPCGHNDCPQPWDLVLGFLARNGLLAEDGVAPQRGSSRTGIF